MREYDVIAVGGGPSGAAAALELGRAGLKVLIAERRRFPREKACGDLLSARAVAELKTLGLLSELLSLPHVPVQRVSYFAPDGAQVTVPVSKPDPEQTVGRIIVRRILLDELILQAAREVAEVEEFCRVVDILRDNGAAVGILADLGGGRVLEAKARVVVGADGYPSMTARKMCVPGQGEFRNVAVRAYYRQVLGLLGNLEIHFLGDVLPGYVWIYPVGNGVTNVGLVLPMTAVKARRIRPARLLDSVITNSGLSHRFEFAECLGRSVAATLPMANPLREIHGPGFVLTGDAGGLANPCAAEGVGHALISGRLAADSIRAAFDAGDFSERGLRSYPLRLWEALGPTVALSERLLTLRTPKAISSLVRSAARRPQNAGWISGILIGSALPGEEVEQFLSYLAVLARV